MAREGKVGGGGEIKNMVYAKTSDELNGNKRTVRERQ